MSNNGDVDLERRNLWGEEKKNRRCYITFTKFYFSYYLLLVGRGRGSNSLLGSSTISGIVLLDGLLGDTLKHLLGECPEQGPGQVQGLEDISGLIVSWLQMVSVSVKMREWWYTLSKEFVFKLLQELEVEAILLCHSLLSDDSLHGLHILTSGIVGIL